MPQLCICRSEHAASKDRGNGLDVCFGKQHAPNSIPASEQDTLVDIVKALGRLAFGLGLWGGIPRKLGGDGLPRLIGW